MGTQTLLTGIAAVALSSVNPTAQAPLSGQPFAIPGSAGMDLFWDLIAGGTALTTMQVDIQGSMDAAFTNPVQIDTLATIGSKGKFITAMQTPFIRARLVLATGGDGTSTLAVRLYIKKRGADV